MSQYMALLQKNRYTIEDYTKIIFDNNYVLSEDVLVKIRELTITLNIIPANKVNISKNEDREDRKNRRDRECQIKDDSWENLRSFKSTVIEKKEGIVKTISDIRSCLNKMSSKNYEKNKDSIVQFIEENTENIGMIAQSIFDIASTNKFFSEVYAELYRELFLKYDVFKSILDDFILKYVENIRNIKYVAPTDNYDDFSAFNKKNDTRKATSTFITNLVKKGVINTSVYIDIVSQIKNIIYDFMEQDNKTCELDEIMENFFILITECIALLIENSSVWSSIRESVVKISGYKSKDKPSLSSRAIFKCMDIIDIEKKHYKI